MNCNLTLNESEQLVISDIRSLIENARQKVAISANATITLLYWHIGERINQEILGNKRAEYGKRIVENIAAYLKFEFGGREFSSRNIHRMMQFAQLIPDLQIVSTLSTQLSWSHFQEVLSLDNELQREFYLTMAAEEHWSVRSLREKINGMSEIMSEIMSETFLARKLQNDINPSAN